MRHPKRHRARTPVEPAEPSINVQTTLRVPAPLYDRAKSFVAKSGSRSFNDLMVSALATYLRAKERKAIDNAFLPMKDDLEYQREAVEMAEQFAGSDTEALLMAERDLFEA